MAEKSRETRKIGRHLDFPLYVPLITIMITSCYMLVSSMSLFMAIPQSLQQRNSYLLVIDTLNLQILETTNLLLKRQLLSHFFVINFVFNETNIKSKVLVLNNS